jgi:hypothetical protein
MSERHISGGSIRKLWPMEAGKFRDHLLRLDKASRRMRFAHGVSDAFIEDYAARMAEMGGIVYAYFDGEDVRAVAELKKLGDTWGREAEAAASSIYASIASPRTTRCALLPVNTRPTCVSSTAKWSAISFPKGRITSPFSQRRSRTVSAT